jgi:hypothetical protein
MSGPPDFTPERKRRLVNLLIDAFAQDLVRTEDELLDLLTRPFPPQPKPLGYTDLEPKLRMTLSNLTEDRRLLQRVEHIPETSPDVVEVFSVVQTRESEQDTWYFITPCQYYFEREIQLDALRIRCVSPQDSLVGTRTGHVYYTGGIYDQYTGEMFQAPHVHTVIGIF